MTVPSNPMLSPYHSSASASLVLLIRRTADVVAGIAPRCRFLHRLRIRLLPLMMMTVVVVLLLSLPLLGSATATSTSSTSFLKGTDTRRRRRRQRQQRRLQEESSSSSSSYSSFSPPTPPVFHIVPHSHCDAAYKKTVDEYYETEVRHVLDSVVAAMGGGDGTGEDEGGEDEGDGNQDGDHINNKSNDYVPSDRRTFVWAETVFLTMWWKDGRTTEEQRRHFRTLAAAGGSSSGDDDHDDDHDGRRRAAAIELVNGGWVMHDEAITRYDSQIHQMTDGHDRLRQMMISTTTATTTTTSGTVGTSSSNSSNSINSSSPPLRIVTGWQIDPFGPSPYTYMLHGSAGMDLLILNRVPYELKDRLRENRALQFYVETESETDKDTETGKTNLDGNNDVRRNRLLINIMDTHYASPKGYDWEDLEHGNVPIIINDTTVNERSRLLMDELLVRANYYRTPHVLVPMGGDFTFQNATLQFENIERIMAHVNGLAKASAKTTTPATNDANNNNNNRNSNDNNGPFQGATLIYSTPQRYKRAVLEYLERQQEPPTQSIKEERENGVGEYDNTTLEVSSLTITRVTPTATNTLIPTMTLQETVALQPLWVGYYFTAPNLKQMLRTCEAVLRTVEVTLARTSLLPSWTTSCRPPPVEANDPADGARPLPPPQLVVPWNPDVSDFIDRTRRVRETVSMMQHHDAITATSYRFVIADYIRRLDGAFRDLTGILGQLLTLATVPTAAEMTAKNKTQGGRDLLEQGGVTGTEQQRQCDDDESGNGQRKSHYHRGDDVDGKIIGGGPYLHESVLVRDAQTAKTIHIDKVLNPPMGYLGGIDLYVANSLSREVESVVHFVCTRDDVAISFLPGDGRNRGKYQQHPVVSQATPLDKELDGAYNFGLFLVSFVARVPPFGAAHFKVQVCDLTWSTFQDPAPALPFLQCATKASPIEEDELLSTGLTSSRIHVEFDPNTLDLSSLTTTSNTTTTKTLTTTSLALKHDFVLYDGTNDNIYIFNTSLESSNPPPLLGDTPRTLVSAYRGPIFSQVTLRFTEWLSIRYRVVDAAATDATLDLTQTALQATVFAGPLPPSVNLASRFEIKQVAPASDGRPASEQPTDWFIEENGFLPVQVSYNSSLPVGDGNTRPLVSRTWLQGQNGGEVQGAAASKRLTITTVDPRGVVSKNDGQVDVFWHRRNTGDWDWWKKGNDGSSVASSVWITASSVQQGDDPVDDALEVESRKLAIQLSNDLVLLSWGSSLGRLIESEHEQQQQQQPLCASNPPSLHPSLQVTTFRLSQADLELNSGRQEAWMDLQVENLSDMSDPIETDVSLLLTNCTRCMLQASSLHSLTYLLVMDNADDVGESTPPSYPADDGSGTSTTVEDVNVNGKNNDDIGVSNKRGGNQFDGCSLEPKDGGKQLILVVPRRRICSIRVPVVHIS